MIITVGSAVDAEGYSRCKGLLIIVKHAAEEGAAWKQETASVGGCDSSDFMHQKHAHLAMLEKLDGASWDGWHRCRSQQGRYHGHAS